LEDGHMENEDVSGEYEPLTDIWNNIFPIIDI